MAATIRLARFGKKGRPSYRIIVVHKRSKRNGDYIEKIGSYDPLLNPVGLVVDKERMKDWLSKGAIPSEGIAKLMKRILKV